MSWLGAFLGILAIAGVNQALMPELHASLLVASFGAEPQGLSSSLYLHSGWSVKQAVQCLSNRTAARRHHSRGWGNSRCSRVRAPACSTALLTQLPSGAATCGLTYPDMTSRLTPSPSPEWFMRHASDVHVVHQRRLWACGAVTAQMRRLFH